MNPERWENGSEFHWIGIPTAGTVDPVPWPSGLLLSSGRDALRVALSVGTEQRGWRRLWVPEYYCQRVTAALVRPGLELMAYPDHPLRAIPSLLDARPGDAVLVMNYFGLRSSVRPVTCDGVEIIEDHSHDPTSDWAMSSVADFCIASLRKTLPLSDGGVLWSPLGHVLPPALGLTSQRGGAAATKLAAMLLKAMYLGGHQVEKAAYRALAEDGERQLAVPTVSSISQIAGAVVRSFPISAWRATRAANHSLLSSLLASIGWINVLAPASDNCVPFTCVVLFDTAEQRELVRLRLVQANVFPAVLWPLEETVLQVSTEVRELSRRVLSIHCDGRYGMGDIERVGEIFRRAGIS